MGDQNPGSGDVVASTGQSPDEAFALLSDGIRLSILRELWEAADPLDPEPVAFSDLRKRVGVRDPGQLNYHLGKLVGHFVRRGEDGYELLDAGKRIIRVLVSGTAIADPTLEPVRIDVSCLFCGGPAELSYEDGWLFHRCAGCNARCVVDYPPSLLSRQELPPAGLLDRDPDAVYAAARIWSKHREASVMAGVCPDCSGSMPVERIRICDRHEPDPHDESVCPACGSIFWGVAFHVCAVCKNLWKIPTLYYPTAHPTVLAFFDEHGIAFDIASHEQRVHLLDFHEEVVSEDPLRIRTTIPLDGDELRVTFDDQMRIVALDR